MKLYHEVAHIKDGNSRVGYIMKPGLPGTMGKWYIADLNQFAKTVGDNKVQYFQLDKSGKPIVSYTQEELFWLQQRGLPAITGNTYWSKDISFKKSNIDLMINEGYVILNPVNCVYMMGLRVLTLYAFCSTPVAPLFNQFLIKYLSNSLYSNIKCGGNNFQFSIPEYDVLSKTGLIYHANLVGLKVCTDCNTLSRVEGLKGISVKLEDLKDILSALRQYEM